MEDDHLLNISLKNNKYMRFKPFSLQTFPTWA